MSESSPARVAREPSLRQAFLPLLVLFILLGLSVYLYADNSSYGANQIALLLAGGLAAIIGLRNGMRWPDIQDAITHGIAISTSAILILLAVGSLIGTWILSGAVPTLIHYGLMLMHPSWFYPATCLVCAIVALAIGSSWTVAGTLGVALMGVAHGMGLDPAITAGAVISGAYFGDNMSPLSDTTNLAHAAFARPGPDRLHRAGRRQRGQRRPRRLRRSLGRDGQGVQPRPAPADPAGGGVRAGGQAFPGLSDHPDRRPAGRRFCGDLPAGCRRAPGRR
jgi:hypothetical protein